MCAVAVSAAWIASLIQPLPAHCVTASLARQSNAGSPDRARRSERHATHDPFAGLMRLQRQLKVERAGGKTEGIMRLACSPAACRRASTDAMNPSSKRIAPKPAGPVVGTMQRGPVDAHRPSIPRQVVDLADAAQLAEILPGRRDLKRPHQHEQAGGLCLIGEVLEPVAHPQSAAHRRLGLDAQAPIPGLAKSRMAPASNPPAVPAARRRPPK